MVERKNLYYIVKDGTKIIYKGKDEKKAKMFEHSVLAKEDAMEEARFGTRYESYNKWYY